MMRSLIAPRSFAQIAIVDRDHRSNDRRSFMLCQMAIADRDLDLDREKKIATIDDRRSLMPCCICLPYFRFLPETMTTEAKGGDWVSLIGESSTPEIGITDTPSKPHSYCSVKNGVNDMLDYIALLVALVAPFIIGPCIVGVFQVRTILHALGQNLP